MNNDTSMPTHSYCIYTVEIHNDGYGCPSGDYYNISNVQYQTVVGCQETANTISFDYDHIFYDSSYNEIHEEGSYSEEITFPENDTYNNIGIASSIYFHDIEIPYYFTHEKNRECEKITYISTASTYVNYDAFVSPTIYNNSYDSGTNEGFITFDGNLTYIPDYAFYYEDSEASQITRFASNFSSINIPKCVTRIGERAFSYSSGLTSIYIPDNVTYIGDYSFYNCNVLTNVTIGSGVTSIGSGAFYRCSDLTSITIEATTPPIIGYDTFTYTNDYTIYVPAESVNAYKTASGWSDYSSRIQAI